MNKLTNIVKYLVDQQTTITNLPVRLQWSTLAFITSIIASTIPAALLVQQKGLLITLSLLAMYNMMSTVSGFVTAYTKDIPMSIVTKALVGVMCIGLLVDVMAFFSLEVWVHGTIITAIFSKIIWSRWTMQYDAWISTTSIGEQDTAKDKEYKFSDVQQAEMGAFNIAGLVAATLAATVYVSVDESNTLPIIIVMSIVNIIHMGIVFYVYKNHWSVIATEMDDLAAKRKRKEQEEK